MSIMQLVWKARSKKFALLLLWLGIFAATNASAQNLWQRTNLSNANIVYSLATKSRGDIFSGTNSGAVSWSLGSTSGADVFWISNQSGVWSDSINWSSRKVPGPFDRVFITLAGNYTVTLDVNATITSLTLGDTSQAPTGTQTLLISNRTLTLNDASTIYRSGVFNLAGNLAFGLSGTLTNRGGISWTSGTITGPGTLTNNGNFSIAGVITKLFRAGAAIINAGTINWTDVGSIYSGEGTIFNNLAGAIFNIQGDVFFDGNFYTGIPATFLNAGTIIKSIRTGTTTLEVALNNNGTVEVRAGTVNLSLGGKSSGGIFTVANGANLNLSGGTHILSGLYSGLGAGLVQLTGGTLQIDSTGVTFNFIGGGFRWSGGTITGPGTLTNKGDFSIAGVITKLFRAGATMINAGTINWTDAGSIYSGEGTIFNNLAGAIFNILGDAFFDGNFYSGIPATFINAGTVIKSLSPGTTTFDAIFNNIGGIIDVQSGTINLSRGGNSTGGIFTVADGATLSLRDGIHLFSGTYSGLGAGLVQLAGAILQIDSTGTIFNFTGGGFDWAGGIITGPGTLTNNGNFSITGDITKSFRGGATIINAGIVTWTDIGSIFSGEGTIFNNLAGATFAIQGEAYFDGNFYSGNPLTFLNAGTVIKSIGIGTTTLEVIFNNTGTVEMQTGTLHFPLEYTQTAGTTILNGGNITSTTTLNIQGGTLSGAGTVTANVNLAGQLHPGGKGSPGILNIVGNYIQFPSGASNIEIGGLNIGVQSDQLNISGRATFDGALDISLINSFIPTLNNSFQIVNFGSRVGDFTELNGLGLPNRLYFGVTYSTSSLGLSIRLGFLTATPTSINFGDVSVGNTGTNVTAIANVGISSVNVGSIKISGANAGNFTVDTTRFTLGPLGSKILTIRFTPNMIGASNASLNTFSNNGVVSVPLSGNGVGAAVSLSPQTIQFEGVALGDNSDRMVTVTNTGNANLTINATNLTGANASEFVILSGGGAGTLAPSASRQVAVRFSPRSVGSKTASLVITSNALDSPDTVSLSGIGLSPPPALTISNSNISFGAVVPGASADRTVNLTNTGGSDLNIINTAISGANAGEFSIFSGGGPGTLAPSSFLQITMRFSPQHVGSKTAALVITSNAPTTSDTVSLNGLGTPPILPPPVLQDTARAGESLRLAVTTPQNFQPTVRQLFYRQAGQSGYQVANLTQAGTNFEGIIQSDFVTIRGVEYYVSLSDDQTVATFPTTDPITKPAIIPVQVARLAFPLSLPKEEHRMISVPLALRETAIDSVLMDDYGPYDFLPRNWRIFRWQNGDYAEHLDINAKFTPGAAFWLITRTGDTFDVEKAQSVHSAQAFTITLQPNNWNQIATPFAFEVAWDSVQVAGGKAQVQAPVRWNGQEYEYQQITLQRFEGYFVYNLAATPVTLSVPPREYEIPGNSNENLSKATPQAEKEFVLQIKARGAQSGWKDQQNFVGMLAGATNELDHLDFLEAPPLGDHLRLSIVAAGRAYAGNFHAISQVGGFWDLQLSTTGKKEKVHLTFVDSEKLPKSFQIWLLDQNRQRALPVHNGETTMEIPEKGATQSLRLIVGTAEFASEANAGIPLIPYQFALRQNYPNPFLTPHGQGKSRSAGNPETRIEYELAERAEVKLEIFNLLGQSVRVLINATQSAGAYSANWDGKDHRGNFANSGVYFYRLKAGDPSTGSGQGFVAVRKLVLSR